MSTLVGEAPLPNQPFPLVAIRGGALLPTLELGLSIGRAKSLALMSNLHEGDVVGVVSQKNSAEEPSMDDLFAHGAFARVVSINRSTGRHVRLFVRGLNRFKLGQLDQNGPFLRAYGELLEDQRDNTEEAQLLASELSSKIKGLKGMGAALVELANAGAAPGALADSVAAALPLEPGQVAELLALADVPERLRSVLELLANQLTRAQLKQKIEADVRRQFGKHQREAVLREQLRAIQKELGEPETSGGGLEKLEEQLRAAQLPEETQEVAERELSRLKALSEQAPEANVIRSYLEWLAALPWQKRATVNTDISKVRAQLDQDHSGLDEVKRRILEHLAVQKLSKDTRGTILCLSGPPGVGKTSLGQSIATATGRSFVRIALGGVHDEAEIRGHRRTYVGALPGRIIHALRKAGVKNPVVLLDEVDKLSNAWGRSPEAALLEVLDPEQNSSFTDHYLEQPFDLSEVMFIATANTLETLSPPLKDRMELVELSGYTSQEKIKIARQHLISKRAQQMGVPEKAFELSDETLARIILDYTREAGVRQLDREISRLVRAVALEVAESEDDSVFPTRSIEVEDLAKLLGKPRFHNESKERVAFPGVATGLAWTPFGGDILFIETSKSPGKGRLQITGKLGEVMQESARAALSYIKSHASELDIDPEELDANDLHIHVPAGAVPKDGPSAGVTMFTALVSLFTGRRVHTDTAMTGECTLRGRVLPVGGIKAKLLAAHRAGLTRVILPEQNRRDLDEVPEAALADLDVHFVEDMADVLSIALQDEPSNAPIVPGSPGSSVGGPPANAELRVAPAA
jgi:ATP-dependent Lon protease